MSPNPGPGRPVPAERELIFRAVARLRAGVMALTFAWVGGGGLFLATAWLLLRGGANVGQHLNLLGIYFPGYRVTWPGALIGLLWGALAGALVGGTLAFLYNAIAFRTERRAGSGISRGARPAAGPGARRTPPR